MSENNFDLKRLHGTKYANMSPAEKAFYDSKRSEISNKRLAWLNENRVMDTANQFLGELDALLKKYDAKLVEAKKELTLIESESADVAHAVLFSKTKDILAANSEIQQMKHDERNKKKSDVERITIALDGVAKTRENLPYLQAKVDKDETLRESRLYTPKTKFGETLDYSGKRLIREDV